MTIPTWTDRIEITTVYALREDRLSRYINWENNRPTHTLVSLDEVEAPALGELW